MIKLAISNLAWHQSSQEKLLRFIKDNGFQGIEIAPLKLFGASSYDELFRESGKTILSELNGLHIVSMQSIWFGVTDQLFSDEKSFRNLLCHTKRIIDLAERIGIENIVFGAPKNRIIGNEMDLSIAKRFFQEIGEYALKHHVVFAIEPNPAIYGGNFILTSEDALEWVLKTNMESVRINYDLGTVIENKENISFVKNNIRYIHHIHISEPFLKPIIQRDIHYELGRILDESEYDGWVSIEMGETEDETVKRVIEYVKTVFAS